MRAFKNLDYFRKVSPEHSKPTVTGGLVSLLCMAAIASLVYFEVQKFIEPEITRSTFIGNDSKVQKHVPLNIDIDFFNLPCWMIDIQSKSQVQAISQEELNNSIFKKRLDRSGRPLPEVTKEQVKKQPDAVKLLKEHFDNEEKCNIFGVLPLNRVTGQLIFNS